MTIQEWFARAVAAGLMPDWTDIIASTGVNKYNRIWRLEDPNYNISTWIPYNLQWGVPGETIQLRKDGKDLYSLEWRKPTEQDVRKMCWFYEKHATGNRYNLIQMPLENLSYQYFVGYAGIKYRHCLLADHGQTAPTEQNFKQAYGE